MCNEHGGNMISNAKNDCESLLSSIDFFSQNLHIEQIVEYGFSIFNQLEKPEASAIYTIDESNEVFSVRFHQGYMVHLDQVVRTQKHDDFAVRNGFLLVDKAIQRRYFDDVFIENLNVSKILPLIIDDHLYGFIISTDGKEERNIDFDFLIRFNYLMNLSFEKASRYLERAKLKKEIDRKIFNLNSISQTMKILLSELNVERILQASVDVIREITTSSVTTIGLYDDLQNLINIRSYENIRSNAKVFETFGLNPSHPLLEQTVFDVRLDSEKLSLIFEDVKKLDLLEAEYVVLIVKERILGFVTIGKSMTGKAYDLNLLERIKDITSIMYIALSNANRFEIIKDQREELRLQLGLMKNMNRILKSVNSSENMNELTDMVLSAMNLTFGIETGFLITFDEAQPQVRGGIGDIDDKLDSSLINQMMTQVSTDILSCYTLSDVKEIFGEAFVRQFANINCFICAPIFTNQLFEKPIGMIVVIKTRQRLHEGQTTMIEMLVNSIGPVMSQLLKKEQYDAHYIPRPDYEIERLHRRYWAESDLYHINFTVSVKKIDIIPFVSPDLKAYDEYDHVLYNNVLVVFATSSVAPHLADEVTGVNPDFEEVKSIIAMALL